MSDAKPVLLLSKQMTQSSPAVDDSQCDCACPREVPTFLPPLLRDDSLVHCADLFQTGLPDEHTLMFNPLRDSGVAVVNMPAHRIWEQFRVPRKIDSVSPQDELTRTVTNQLFQAGLVEPVDTQIDLHYAHSKSLGIWLHITNACNLRCDYCYVDKAGEHMLFETGCESIEAGFRSATRGRFQQIKLKFAGGEPTLLGRLVLRLHDYAQQRAAHVGIGLESVLLTNGLNLDDTMIRELAVREISLMISVDGLGKSHDVQRRSTTGHGSFSQASKTLSRLKVFGIKPFISITVSRRNIRGLPEVIAFLLDENLLFSINLYRDNDLASGYSDLALRKDETIDALFQSFETILHRDPERSLLLPLVDRTRLDHLHNKSCGAGECYMAVDPRGGIAGCQMTLNHPITDIRAEDPLDVLCNNSERMLNLSVDQKEGCSQCQWRYWCAGGCPLMTFRTTGRYDTRSPYCEIYQSIFPELVRLEGMRLMKLAERLDKL